MLANVKDTSPSMAQGTPVEARSLSSLTNLAANPPAYPRNPTQKPLEPLVLYIVRVPGSKDVFLSPLKPPTKSSVSPEALNASLYFLHVSGPDDEALRESVEQERLVDLQNTHNENTAGEQAGGRDSKFAFLNRIRRKPVPGTERTTTPQDRASPPKSSLEGCNVENQDDSEVGNLQGGPSPDKRPLNERAPLPRRPLPPLPADQEDQLLPPIPKNSVSPGRASWDGGRRQRKLPAQAPVTDGPSHGRVSWDGGRQPFHLTGSSPAKDNNAGQYLGPAEPTAGYFGHRHNYNKERETQPSSRIRRPFHITLIRRDPTHGHQWNVGTITNSSSAAPSEVASDGAITVEIMTPGYKRFAGDNSKPVSLESLGLTQASLPRHSIRSPSEHPQDTNLPSDKSELTNTRPAASLNFVRKVAIAQHTTAASNSSPHSTKHDGHRRRYSRDITDLSHAHPHPHPSKPARANYKFTSPWNGTCTFTTGPNGRSLKCKHVIPNPATTTTTSDQEADSPPSVTVGEIRFNLPSTTTMGRVPTPAATPSHPPQQQQQHHHHHHHSGYSQPSTPTSSTPPTRQGAWDTPLQRAPEPEPEPEPGRMDLRLGRERAGGGLRGRSAKLGKLIIEDEGMKMLDLLVAACMGVWWGVYDQD